MQTNADDVIAARLAQLSQSSPHLILIRVNSGRSDEFRVASTAAQSGAAVVSIDNGEFDQQETGD